MYNDFVIVGPVGDPAGIRMIPSLGAVLVQLAKGKAPFISRGDDSGTHKKEQELWGAVGENPGGFDPGWYRATGLGMGISLNIANALGAYILTDRATWLTFGNKGDLELFFQGDPALFNQYAFIPVNPARQRHVNHAGAVALEAWLISDTGQTAIASHTLEGQKLFKPNTPLK